MKIIAANWKLNKNPQESVDFFKAIKTRLKSVENKKLLVFPSAPSFSAVNDSLIGTGWEWGSQNCYSEISGAFTGEVSAKVVKDMGGKWVLVGHSERRKIFGESDEQLSMKLKLVQGLALTPMLCIGESLDERRAGHTESVINKQLKIGLSIADKGLPLAVAYEPVWAIGTGQVASLDQVREAHLWVRNILVSLGFSKEIPILYGGSVKADNATELAKIKNVDGFLIGGASLDPESLEQIYLRS